MKYSYSLSLWLLQIVYIVAALDEETIKDTLKKFNTEMAEIHREIVKARWDYEITRSGPSEEKLMELYKKEAEEAKSRFREVNSKPWKVNDGDLKKQFRKISNFGFELLPEDEFIRTKKIEIEIESIERDIHICDYNNSNNCDLIMRDVRSKMAASKNPNELKYFWEEWRKAAGYRLRTLFTEYVKLSNKAATLNNFTNFEEYLLRNFKTSNVKQEMESLWEKIKPLYLELHAYVRRRLSETYGEEIVSKEGSIPGYLLNDLWPENWNGIYHLVVPYPNQDHWNKTRLLINKGYNTTILHQQAEEFFSSMNFPLLSNIVWVNGSNLTDCREGVFDFDNSIRILHCGDEISFENSLAYLKLVAKAEYMQQYKEQPFVYQEAADPGLEKAISDLTELSYSSPQHMKKLGIIEEEDNQSRINRLMEMALRKIASIPATLATEFWRWGVFKGEINEDNYDCKYWDIIRTFQGISTFTRDLNFDPGGPFNLFSKTSLIHDFVGSIAQFQIHNSLCQISGTFYPQEHDIDNCDLYQSKEAGLWLRNAMSEGSSKTPTNILEMLTGDKTLHVDSILEYFQPLMKWLQEENRRTNELIGWKNDDEHGCRENHHRRKRSLEYIEEEPESSKIQYLEPDRYQQYIKRSRRNDKSTDQNSERHRKNANEENQKTSLTNMDKSSNEGGNGEKSPQKPLRRRSIIYKRRRSPNYSQWNDDGRLNDDYKKSMKFKSSWNGKNREPESYETNREKHYTRRYVKRLRKRGDAKDDEKKETEQNSQSKSLEDSKTRSARKAYHVRNDGYDENQHHRVRQRKNVDVYENEKEAKELKMHTNSKKDISRLLHSFGFSVEDKDKIKELKKNNDESEYEEDRKVGFSPESGVSSWANQEMKKKNYMKKQKYSNFDDSNANANNNNNRFINTLLNEGRYSPDMANEGTSYESVIDINRLSKDKLTGFGADKSKVWSINDFLSNSGKFAKAPNSKLDSYVLQNGKVVGKKDILSALEQASKSAVKTRADDSGESVNNMDMDMSSLQNLLKTVNLNTLGQNPNDARFKSNQFFGSKGDKFKEFRFTGEENSAFKDRKEFKEEDGNKSPFIIIVGQITPEMKERLLQGKGNLQPFFQSFANGEKSAQWDDTQKTDGYFNKNNGKREDNEKIYIVPINVKSNQHNLVKTNKFTEHEHDTGHENTEREQETEEQYHLIDSSKLDDRNAYRQKEYPSEVYVSWEGFDKNNKRIARRIKREHKKQKESNADMKSVKLVPMKESTLERLLGNNLDHLNLDDKSLKMLANGLANLEGTPGQASLLSGLSSLAKSQGNKNSWFQNAEESDDSKLDSNSDNSLVNKELKDKDTDSGLTNPTLRCNTCGSKKNNTKCCPPPCPEECCKKVFVLSCPPKCPPPCPPPCGPCPCPCPLPCPCPPPCGPCCPPPCPKPCPCPCPCPPPCGPVPCPLPWPIPCPTCPSDKCDPVCCEPKDICCKKPSECSMVNCQFKITKAKKPHERLTIMIYDRINPPEELPEPYDALAVISEVLQKIQCQTCKPPCPPQLTEEDPDYPANDNTDQLKAQNVDKNKQQESNNEESPNLENPEEEESDDNSRNSAEGDKSQSKEKATPALDQLTVFNKDKLAPVLLELRKIDDLIKKRNP